MGRTRLSIVIVSYNTRELLSQCLGSIYQSDFQDGLEVFVVDNGSSDGSAQLVRDKYPQVSLMANQRNVGFAAANNQALKQVSGEFILLLNPDTVLARDACESMVKFLQAHSEVAAVGAKLIGPEGDVQRSWGSFPNLAGHIFDYLLFGNLWSRLSPMPSKKESFEIDWVSGAALMVKQEVIEKVGVLDECFFMYAEEKDWCWRMKKAGWKIYYLPRAQVVHYGEASTSQVVSKMHVEFYRSQLKFLSKHYGKIYRCLLRSVMAVGALERFLVWGAIRVFSLGQYQVAKQRTKAYFKILKLLCGGKTS